MTQRLKPQGGRVEPWAIHSFTEAASTHESKGHRTSQGGTMLDHYGRHEQQQFGRFGDLGLKITQGVGLARFSKKLRRTVWWFPSKPLPMAGSQFHQNYGWRLPEGQGGVIKLLASIPSKVPQMSWPPDRVLCIFLFCPYGLSSVNC